MVILIWSFQDQNIIDHNKMVLGSMDIVIWSFQDQIVVGHHTIGLTKIENLGRHRE